MSKKPWMLIGAQGNLGRSLQFLWPHFFPHDELVSVGRNDVRTQSGLKVEGSLDSLSDIERLLNYTRPQAVINCAALSNPVICELNPKRAMQVNCDMIAPIADYLRANGGWMLTCSTDFVFSGECDGLLDEDQIAEPRTVYGITKLAGEHMLLERDIGLVARLSLMFDPLEGPSLCAWAKVRSNLEANASVIGVTDEWRTPISFCAVAEILLTLARQKRKGIVHVGGPSRLSPYELIERLRAIGLSSSTIVPTLRAEMSSMLDRPKSVALSSKRLNSWIGSHLIPDAFTKHSKYTLDN